MSLQRSEPFLWIAAIAVAALGTWVMFDASPGIGWGLWVTAAALGLLIFVRHNRPLIALPAVLASVIAWGAAVTADQFLYALIFLSVVVFLALEMLLSSEPRIDRVTPTFTVAAPVVAFASVILESIGRATSALHVVRSDRARSVVRGIAITIPVLIFFALLLAAADPLFANLRDNIQRILESWDFLPRIIFFIALLVCTLGAYGFAMNESARVHTPAIEAPARRWLGDTERMILTGSVTLLLWIFLAVQLSYLFGNAPRTTGSGFTFAEYAKRGFAELTVVASASVFLILFCERFGEITTGKNILRAVTVALIIAVLLLLGSAFRRVLLYEGAYGFTTARLYAQAYMVVVAVALVWLVVELRHDLNPARLFRVTGLAATTAFIVLIYWNHEAWIASRNLDRVASTGKLDVSYLTRDLSPNAVPVLVDRLPQLPEPFRTDLRNQLFRRYAQTGRLAQPGWYEYSVRRDAARNALTRLGVPIRSAR
jgi:hypothetical protein